MHLVFKTNLFPVLFLVSCGFSLISGCGGIGPIKTNTITEGYLGENQKEKVIVFIHGLFGHAQNTWENEQTKAYWPNLLRNDPKFQDYALYLIAYPSPQLAKASTIEEIATRELQKLKDNGVFEKHQQIYFLTHSMGGLIAKRLLVKLHLPNPEELKMLDKVRAVIFLSTPSQGSEMTKIVSMFSQNPQPSDLESANHNSFLQSLENEWQNLFLDRSDGVAFPKSFCAYETMPTFGVMIVSRVSASTMCDNNPYAMDLNHLEMAKPANDNVDPYKWVRARILDVASIDARSRMDILTNKLRETPVEMALRPEDKSNPVSVEGRIISKGGYSELQNITQIQDGVSPITSLVFNLGRWHFAAPAIQQYLTELSRHHDLKFIVFLENDQYRGWVPANTFLDLFYSDPEGVTLHLNARDLFNEFSAQFYFHKGQVSASTSAFEVKEYLEKTGEPGIAVLDRFGALKGIASRTGIDSQILNQIFLARITN